MTKTAEFAEMKSYRNCMNNWKICDINEKNYKNDKNERNDRKEMK